MAIGELEAYMRSQMEINPLIEEVPLSEKPQVVLEQIDDWSGVKKRKKIQLNSENDEYCDREAISDVSDTLVDFLRDQIERLEVPIWQKELCCYLADLLDEDGYLFGLDVADLSDWLNMSENLIEQSVNLVQSLEPAGVGARNVKECLILQLRRKDNAELATQIVRFCLPMLAKQKYKMIASKLKCSFDQVMEAVKLIRSLNPRPGSEFFQRQLVHYIHPDLSATVKGDTIKLHMNENTQLSFRLDSSYLKMLQVTNCPETKAYLQEKYDQASWIFTCIKRRQETLESCVRSMLSRQSALVADPNAILHPLTLSDVAKDTGLHESTVCRALQGKYIRCDHGILPLSSFFSQYAKSVSGDNISVNEVKSTLLHLVNEEDKQNPLSDQEIMEALISNLGISIARRTIAKYRSEMNIPNRHERVL